MTNNALAQQFNWKKLIQFTLPTILMMISLSLYTTVDGIMVSRLISENALAAVNIVFPIVSLVLAVALMFSSGSNAIVSYLLGEQKVKEARQKLTLTLQTGILVSLIITLLGIVFLNPILSLLGTSDSLMPYAVPYLKIMLYFAPVIFLQIFVQTFLVTEGKPMHGLVLSIISGVTNIILDYVFIAVFHWGISGAAIATGIGYAITGGFGFIYFAFYPKAHLRLTKSPLDLKFLFNTITNGSSEMVNNLSVAFTTFLFNIIMMRLIGNEGVVAITIILYVQFIQMALYFGFSQGISPVISYKYGSQDWNGLKNILKKSFTFIFVSSFIVIALSMIFVNPVIALFVKKGTAVFDLAKQGFMIYLLAYIFMGINVFMSAMFTALGNGKVSAMLSFLRTFVFLVGSLLLLPQCLGVIGVWLAVPLSELLSFGLSWFAYQRGKSRYQYA